MRWTKAAIAALALAMATVFPATAQERTPLLELAQQYGAEAIAVFVDTDLGACLLRNDTRTGRSQVPLVGIYATAKRLVAPTIAEGFARVEVIRHE